jgi:hypothetical protein
MTTILTLEPLSGNWAIVNGPGGTMKRNFGGAGLSFWAWEGATTREWLGLPAGTQVKRVKYPASLSPQSITEGVCALSDAITTTDDTMLVFAHSQGAQAVSRWLRERADADPGRVQFLLIGNPLRKYGGYGVGRPEVDGRKGLPTPTDTPFRVSDVKLRYDGWADWPTMTNGWSVANANQDRIGINGNRAIHCMGYRTANLFDPARRTYREQGTQFVLLPHAPLLPLPVAQIEAGYRRPEDGSNA